MRPLLYFITAISGLIFLINVFSYSIDYFRSQSFGSVESMISEGSEAYPEYGHEDEKINRKIRHWVAKAERNDNIYSWLSFSVVSLTAVSTFVSALQAARKEPTNQNSARKYLIICAFLTLLSSLMNFAAKQVNDSKDQALQNAAFLSKK